ncbi:MAG: hypothetical protein HYZ15_09685 [Sphingobacteriales bacterium]|nr:hypothetical protein [Sphingobacteriales bacterium]
MHTRISTLAALLCLLSACSGTNNREPQQLQTPKALEAEKSSYSIELSKRGPADLVEELYQEIAEKQPALKKLEEQISELRAGESDSTENLNQFINKNNSYYEATEKHLSRISDSLLKDRIRELIRGSFSRYNNAVNHPGQLLKIIEHNNLSLADLHAAVKLVQTLRVMEKYQQDHKPSTDPLEKFILNQELAKQGADSLAR